MPITFRAEWQVRDVARLTPQRPPLEHGRCVVGGAGRARGCRGCRPADHHGVSVSDAVKGVAGLDPIPQLVRREQLVQLNVSRLHASGPCSELAMCDPRWIELATV